MNHSALKKYGYAWVTLVFFLFSLVLHWVFGWFAFADQAAEHGAPPELAGYLNEMLRDTFENWQSEFLQLLWQVAGLAYLLYVGSPSSKENDDRMEAKLDALILLKAGTDRGQEIIDELDERYLRDRGHAQPHARGAEPVVGSRDRDRA